MKVLKISSESGLANSYLVSNGSKECILIDCASGHVFDVCDSLNMQPAAVLLTHGHFDHVGGCGECKKRGIPLYCGEKEKDFIFSRENRGIFGGVYIPEFEISGTFKDGEEITLSGLKIKVISTSGHTAGSVTYLIEDTLFTGDTLFRGSIGRSDLPTGNTKILYESVKKLFALSGGYQINSGHGEDSTLEYERKFNPYVRL